MSESVAARGPAEGGGFPVVGIGVAKVDLRVLKEILGCLPVDIDAALIIVTHGPSGHVEALPDWLTRACALPVVPFDETVELAGRRIYLPPPGATVVCRGMFLAIVETSEAHLAARPVDALFRSLAAAHGERAVGIVLAGCGQDGALGASAIEEAAGAVITQVSPSAHDVHAPGNPNDAPRARRVLPAAELADALLTRLKEPPLDASARGRAGGRSFTGGRILVVEDDGPSREATCELLTLSGYSSYAVASSAAALRWCRREEAPAVIVCDYLLPDQITGIHLINEVRDLYREAVPAILVTGLADPEIADEAQRNACQLLRKPVSTRDLLASLDAYIGDPAVTAHGTIAS